MCVNVRQDEGIEPSSCMTVGVTGSLRLVVKRTLSAG